MSYPGLINDIIFKVVFGGSQSQTVLKHLLNALLNLQVGQRITELEILSPSPEQIYFEEKRPVLDLKAQDEKGIFYNVEVQLRGVDIDYIKRSLYYTTRLYSDQLKSGHDYHLLQKSISISILDFILFPDRTELHSTFTLWDRAQDVELTKDLELHYLELPKFASDKPRLLQTRFEKWLYILKFSDLYHTRDLPENLKDEEGIPMAIDAMRKAYAKDHIRATIEAQEKAERDEISRISFAERKGREEGRKEGRKEAEAEIARLKAELERLRQAQKSREE